MVNCWELGNAAFLGQHLLNLILGDDALIKMHSGWHACLH
jgi:hypothetical protein